MKGKVFDKLVATNQGQEGSRKRGNGTATKKYLVEFIYHRLQLILGKNLSEFAGYSSKVLDRNRARLEKMT